MIRTRTAARIMPAIWFAPVIVLLACWYVRQLPAEYGYGADASGKASLLLIFLTSFCSGCAAWEGSRLRRAGVWAWPFARPRWHVIAWIVTPVVAVGLVAFLAGTGSELVADAAWPPDPRILAVGVADLVTASLVGLAAGLLLPSAAALPLAIVAPFVWTGVVPALPVVWLRHLTGTFRDCCMLSEQVAWSPVVASLIVDVGAVLALGYLIARPGFVRAELARAIAAFCIAVALASVAVAGFGYAPVEPRSPAAMECHQADQIRLCVWPEHAIVAQRLASLAATVHAKWTAAGIQAPTTFSEAHRSLVASDTLPFVVDVHASDEQVVLALANALAPQGPDCPLGDTGAIATFYLTAWYAFAGGAPMDAIEREYGYPTDPYTSVPNMVSALAHASVRQRSAWTQRALAVSQRCDDWPADLLAVGP